jgi:filamentous hemagglutinin family protein
MRAVKVLYPRRMKNRHLAGAKASGLNDWMRVHIARIWTRIQSLSRECFRASLNADFSFFLGILFALPFSLWGHGENPTVVRGHAEFEYPDSKTQVIKAADKTIINYKQFNVAADEMVRFIQPHPKASVLCRVTGNASSTIAGQIEANGRFFFINPFGIFFSDTAQIKVGSLVASTLDIKDEDFVEGKYRFTMDPSSRDKAIVNRGTIDATSGSVAFLGAKLINQGLVIAKASRLSLGGEVIALDFDGDNKIAFAIEAPLVKGLIEESGKTVAEGIVVLSRGAAKAAIGRVVNTDGLQEAGIIQNDNGTIRLLPGSSITAKKLEIDGASVEINGSLAIPEKIEAHADKLIHWNKAELTAKPKEGVHLEAPNGKIIIDSPLGDKYLVGKAVLVAKTIEQNDMIKAAGPVSYQASQLRLGGDIRAASQIIDIDAPVVLTGNVKIFSGKSGGRVHFKSTIDSEKKPYNLTIEPASEANTVEFRGKIGSANSLRELKIATGNLILNGIGDVQPGASRVEIDVTQISCEGTAYYASQQKWKSNGMQINNRQPSIFKTDGQPLSFNSIPLTVKGDASLTFETQGGDLEMPSITGLNFPMITVNAGKGKVETSLIQGGPVKVEGQHVHMRGNIQAEKVVIDAEYHIADIAPSNPIKICALNEILLHAKLGSIGSEERPINVETEGVFSLGAKVSANVNSASRPSIYQKECPALFVCNGMPVESHTYASSNILSLLESSIEEQMKSLTPDLFHRTPENYTDGSSLTPRRALIYYMRHLQRPHMVE